MIEVKNVFIICINFSFLLGIKMNMKHIWGKWKFFAAVSLFPSNKSFSLSFAWLTISDCLFRCFLRHLSTLRISVFFLRCYVVHLLMFPLSCLLSLFVCACVCVDFTCWKWIKLRNVFKFYTHSRAKKNSLSEWGKK